MLIAIKLKQKGRETNAEANLTSRDTTIFYFAFWGSQSHGRQLTSDNLFSATARSFFRKNLIKHNWSSWLTFVPEKSRLWLVFSAEGTAEMQLLFGGEKLAYVS